jgi:hypothetical protein
MVVDQCSTTGVPLQVFMCAVKFYKKFYVHILQSERGNILYFMISIHNKHTPDASSVVLFYMCYILFLYACVITGQGFVCRYMFMAMYSFVPTSCEVVFCGVLSCVFDKLQCTMGKKKVAEH